MAGTITSFDEELKRQQQAAPQTAQTAQKPQTARQTTKGVKAPQVVTPEISDVPSQSYSQAASALSNASSKPTYANTYGGRLDELYQQIVSRPKFNYDVNADPLYQSLKDQYVQQGKLAMRDTVAQGAALTGGYDNTYGQQVGQQTYDAYLQNLASAIPELYGQARDTYQMEGDRLNQQYGMLNDLADDEYGKYRDALSDYNYDQEWQTEQQKYAYTNLYNLITNSGYSPSEAELAAAGMSADEAASLKAKFDYDRQTAEKMYADQLAQQAWENAFKERQFAASQASSGGGGRGGGGSSGGGGAESYGYSDIAGLAMQAAAGGASPAQINTAVQSALSSPGYTGSNTGNSDYVRAMRAAADAARNAGTYNSSQWKFKV